MIIVEAKKIGTRMIATVKAGIGTGRFTYTVNLRIKEEVANEAEAQSELRKTLKKFSRLLVHRKVGHAKQLPFPKPRARNCLRKQVLSA
jgi:hypothetical protein